MKPLVIIAIIIFLIGGALFGIALYNNGSFDFNSYVTKTNTIEEDFSSIEADLDTTDIEILPATDGKCTAVFTEQEKHPHSYTVEDGTLKIDAYEKKWYDHISIYTKHSKITLYLPKSEYERIEIEQDTGDITIDKALGFKDIKLQTDTGDVFVFASAENLCKISTDTGHITVKDITAESFSAKRSTGRLSIENLTVTGRAEIRGSTGNAALKNISVGGALDIATSTGKIVADTLTAESLSINGGTSKIALSDVTVKTSADIKNSTGDVSVTGMAADSLAIKLSTGDILLKDCVLKSKIQVNTSTGNIVFDSSDAPDISVHTDTGSVTGTLLTGKIFDAESDTGSITVPEDSTEGGRCEITTDTGRISISIK